MFNPFLAGRTIRGMPVRKAYSLVYTTNIERQLKLVVTSIGRVREEVLLPIYRPNWHCASSRN
jgi:hypothetical protein